MTEGILPIAEKFVSVQGEGTWVGTLMLFVRLAGCNVGRPAAAVKAQNPFPLLPTGKEAMACTSWDGRTFPCDTDYNLTARVKLEDVVQEAKSLGVRHVCCTGGEPLMFADRVDRLYVLLAQHDILLHVETSGTLQPTDPKHDRLIMPGVWITVSPKIGALDTMIRRADELKLLVDQDFDEYRLTPSMLKHKNVFVCPINDIEHITLANVRRCRTLLDGHPEWRMSFQVHKMFGWR